MRHICEFLEAWLLETHQPVLNIRICLVVGVYVPPWGRVMLLRLTCSLVGLDFLQACERSERPAFFEGHNRDHVLLVLQPQLWGLGSHWQLDSMLYSAIGHRLCVFLWLDFLWQDPHWCRLLCWKGLTNLVKARLCGFQRWSWLVVSWCLMCVMRAPEQCTF